MRNAPMYEVDVSLTPPSCLPAGVDRGDFVDITTVGAPWRVYLDTQTGTVHDGSVYAAEMNSTANGGAGRVCGACDGSGCVPRDPDIGTDQPCFSCDGSGRAE